MCVYVCVTVCVGCMWMPDGVRARACICVYGVTSVREQIIEAACGCVVVSVHAHAFVCMV